MDKRVLFDFTSNCNTFLCILSLYDPPTEDLTNYDFPHISYSFLSQVYMFHPFYRVIHKRKLEGKSYGTEISHPKPIIYRSPYNRSNQLMTKSICNRIVSIADAYIY